MCGYGGSHTPACLQVPGAGAAGLRRAAGAVGLRRAAGAVGLRKVTGAVGLRICANGSVFNPIRSSLAPCDSIPT